MQLMTRNVMVTIDTVILKLSDLDKSIATPELVRAGKDQWLEFEILNPLGIMACRAGFHGRLSADGLRVLIFRMFTAGAVAGLATNICQLGRCFYAFESTLVVACSVAFVAFLKLVLLELWLHDGYRIPRVGFFGVFDKRIILLFMAWSAVFRAYVSF